MTLAQLSNEFRRNYMEPRLRPSTIRGYVTNLEKHILPSLGAFDVCHVAVEDLDRLTANLRAHLSNKSIVYVHATLRKMLAYALKREYITKSPYDSFDMPRVEKYRYQVLCENEMRRLLDLVKNTALEIPVTLALYYGLRRGECLGIKPLQDLDSHANVLHVQRTRSTEHGATIVTPCKTEKSNRLILLTPAHTEMLKNAPCDSEGYACPLSPYQLDTRYRAFLKQNQFPLIRFHDLRHSYATFMLAKGVNAKIVSAVLGHSGVGVTLDIYSHPDVQMQRACLQAFTGV